MPLQSLQHWLFKPKVPNLVEASEAAVPYKALAIAITQRMLYEETPPLVGVGLVYKPHYVPTVLFSAAYVHLNIWQFAASDEESENWLDEPHLLLVNISEMSDVVPVAVRHPILLDLMSKEVVGDTGEPVSPLSFQGFRLHMTWTQLPGGEQSHHISFPHFLGEDYSPLINYESERFPQDLMQGQKIEIDLQPPAKDHWNIVSDRVLPCVLEDSLQQHEAKLATQAQETRLVGTTVCPTEAPTLEEPPRLEALGSEKELPTRMAPSREHILEATRVIIERFHTLHLQTMHEMGGVQEVDRALTRTLLAEFVRLQPVVGEEFTKILMDLHTDLEVSSATLVSDIVRTMNLHPDDPVSHQLKAALWKFQQTTSLKLTLPLMELEAAH